MRASRGYLDEATRRRIAAVVLALAVVVVTLAVADVGPFSDPPTEAERAQATVEDFFAAANAKQYGRMCADLTPAIRQQVLARTLALLRGKAEVKDCGQALALQDKLLAERAGQPLSQTRIVRVTDSRVSGNLARVDVMLSFPGSKRPEAHTFPLQLVDGRW